MKPRKTRRGPRERSFGTRQFLAARSVAQALSFPCAPCLPWFPNSEFRLNSRRQNENWLATGESFWSPTCVAPLAGRALLLACRDTKTRPFPVRYRGAVSTRFSVANRMETTVNYPTCRGLNAIYDPQVCGIPIFPNPWQIQQQVERLALRRAARHDHLTCSVTHGCLPDRSGLVWMHRDCPCVHWPFLS